MLLFLSSVKRHPIRDTDRGYRITGWEGFQQFFSLIIQLVAEFVTEIVGRIFLFDFFLT